MPNSSVNRIRKLHDKYLNDRKRFDDAKGIIAPIRAVLFYDMTDFTEFLLAYSWMTDDDKQRFRRSVSSHIGYFVACKDSGTNKVVTGWSLCATADLDENLFDKEFGMHMAISRLFNKNPKYSVNAIANEPHARSFMVTKTSPILFFDEYTIEEQADEFIKRCIKYYKTSEIE